MSYLRFAFVFMALTYSMCASADVRSKLFTCPEIMNEFTPDLLVRFEHSTQTILKCINELSADDISQTRVFEQVIWRYHESTKAKPILEALIDKEGFNMRGTVYNIVNAAVEFDLPDLIRKALKKNNMVVRKYIERESLIAAVSTDMMELLLANGADPNSTVGPTTTIRMWKFDGHTPLTHLLDNVFPHISNQFNYRLHSPFSTVYKNVEILIANGADVNKKDDNDETPLEALVYQMDYACDSTCGVDNAAMKEDLAKLLIKYGADIFLVRGMHSSFWGGNLDISRDFLLRISLKNELQKEARNCHRILKHFPIMSPELMREFEYTYKDISKSCTNGEDLLEYLLNN